MLVPSLVRIGFQRMIRSGGTFVAWVAALGLAAASHAAEKPARPNSSSSTPASRRAAAEFGDVNRLRIVADRDNVATTSRRERHFVAR